MSSGTQVSQLGLSGKIYFQRRPNRAKETLLGAAIFPFFLFGHSCLTSGFSILGFTIFLSCIFLYAWVRKLSQNTRRTERYLWFSRHAFGFENDGVNSDERYWVDVADILETEVTKRSKEVGKKVVVLKMKDGQQFNIDPRDVKFD